MTEPATEDRKRQARYSFQYFDEACDVGVENENGERVRKRKKPGRKPNPPSQQERREQNRLAQRNFREREQQRRKEREQQWKEYLAELAAIRRRLAIAEYENNYLRGWILQLMLSSIAQNGTVPQVWVDTRQYPIARPSMMSSTTTTASNGSEEVYQIPPMLDMVLDSHSRSILGLKDAMKIADGGSPSCPLVRRAHHFRTKQQQQSQHMTTTELPIPPPPSAVTPCQFKSIQELLSTDIMSLNTDSQDVRHLFPPWMPTSSIRAVYPSTNDGGSKSPESSDGQQHKSEAAAAAPRGNQRSHSPTATAAPPSPSLVSIPDTDLDKRNIRVASPTIILPELLTSPQAIPVTTVSAIKRTQSVKGIIYESPTLKRPEDLTHMPPIQALHVLRLQLKVGSLIGEMVPYALTPTALQRVIPHDVRIDYVPSGTMRDRMIIFQDYFDMDECIQFLCGNSVFVGGDIRDSRNWVLDESVSETYWFFSHHLYDHHFDDCHIPEEFTEELKGWTVKQQGLYQQQQQKQQYGSASTPECPVDLSCSSNNSDSLPTPS